MARTHLDRKNIELGKLIYRLRQAIDVLRVIGLILSKMNAYVATRRPLASRGGHILASQDPIALLASSLSPGYPEHYSKATLLAAGCDAYLLKPIDTRKLSGQLAAAIEGGDAVNEQAK